MNFLEVNSLNREQSADLINLQQALKKQYQSTPSVYWHILKKPRPMPCNLLGYNGKELIAFASRFLFHQGTTEISLLIHPQLQNEFMAKQLFYGLLKYIPKDYKEFITLCTPHQQRPLIQANNSLWTKEYSSIRLQWFGPAKKPSVMVDYSLEKAKLEHFQEFKNLCKVAFPHGTDMVPEIYNELLTGSATQLTLLKHHEQIIGSIQVNQENKYYRISDIAVLPEFRGKGLGNYLLKSILHQLVQRQKPIVLDVEDNNEVALKWYLGLGMKKINTCDFWRLPFAEFVK